MLKRSHSGTWAKICGITNARDAKMVVAGGADALGVNLFPQSKRFTELDACRVWLRDLEDKILRVAVVVNPSAEEVGMLRDSGVFDAIQFHGDETPEFCERSGFELWIKAVRVQNRESLDHALTFPTPVLLLDGWVSGAYGGAGARLDWDLARQFVIAHPDRQIVLAGGLLPSNLTDALRISRPFGVDVASGVEVTPREKDEYLVREFLRISREFPMVPAPGP